LRGRGFAQSLIVSVVKFRQLRSFRNWSAKLGFFVAILASIPLLVDGPVSPLRVAFVVVATANSESISITLRLETPRQEVRPVTRSQSHAC